MNPRVAIEYLRDTEWEDGFQCHRCWGLSPHGATDNRRSREAGLAFCRANNRSTWFYEKPSYARETPGHLADCALAAALESLGETVIRRPERRADST